MTASEICLSRHHKIHIFLMHFFLSAKTLTVAISVEQEWILQLKLQVFIYWLHKVLCTQSIHDGEAMMRRGRPTKINK